MPTNAEKALEHYKKLEGKEEGVSDWHVIDQKQINLFADATLDRQFIHVDPEMAAQMSPYKVTIAHGFLTLSMVVYLGAGIRGADPAAYEGLMMGVNYGLDKVRFPAPVKVGSRIRARRELISADLVAANTIQLKQKVTIEIEGETKPGCVAETLARLIYS
jgi:acyl dehydratase